MTRDSFACPQQRDDRVPQDAPGSVTMLPGERASTVIVSAVVNSLFRWTLKTKGSFRKFLLSVVAKPKGDVRKPYVKARW